MFIGKFKLNPVGMAQAWLFYSKHLLKCVRLHWDKQDSIKMMTIWSNENLILADDWVVWVYASLTYKYHTLVDMLWFNFIPGLNFIFLSFKPIIMPKNKEKWIFFNQESVIESQQVSTDQR